MGRGRVGVGWDEMVWVGVGWGRVWGRGRVYGTFGPSMNAFC